jgi:hypothetical protein
VNATLSADTDIERWSPAQASLVDLLDRLLGVGVVLAGDVTLSLAGVDLVTIKLRALIATVPDGR